MATIIVLGAGMVGSAMALDLAASGHHVTACDRNKETLEKLHQRNASIAVRTLDVSDRAALRAAIAPFDLVLSAVPGFLGFQTLKTIIEEGKNVVDISFFPEDALPLDALAKSKGVTAITDCGVAPGMDNFILGYYNARMKVEEFECLVGGLPKVRKWPFMYKAPFSPMDVVEEYVRPARYVENGHVVIKPALSDPELLEFDRVGTLESFNSDGLRSIIYTMGHIPNMKEKTLRFPGHIEYIRMLKEVGFFDEHTINVNGTAIRPIDFTSKLLFNEWKLGDTEEEFTVMRVTVKGEGKTIVYDLYDEYDQATNISSMARTTGYTATAAVNMFLNSLFTEKGVFPPELIGQHAACFEFVIGYLKERGVHYTVKA